MTAAEAPGDPEPSGTGPPGTGAPRPYDPERGLRGIMSATLILEAISVLLSIPVAANTDGGVGALGISLICLLALVLVLACGVVSRPYAIQVILGLQVLAIAGWFITPSLGGIGIVFSIAWAVILWFRAEFRRRLAAGTLPGPPQPSGP
ncbi:DUF4233 domain-containing protein [Nakamurella sp. GG22]